MLGAWGCLSLSVFSWDAFAEKSPFSCDVYGIPLASAGSVLILAYYRLL